MAERLVLCGGRTARTRNGKHCGVCSKCIDRRFAILGAGLGQHEPEGTYEIDCSATSESPAPT